MGCGASNGGGGSNMEKFVPKKSGKCLAPCEFADCEPKGDMRTAIIDEVIQEKDESGKVITGGKTTYNVYFPEFEPALGGFPDGVDEASLKKFRDEQIAAAKAMVPGTKKTSLQTGLTADQLQRNPYPTQCNDMSMVLTKIEVLDLILQPVGASLTLIVNTNNAIYAAWEENFRLEKKYGLDFIELMKLAKDDIVKAVKNKSLDGITDPHKLDVAKAAFALFTAGKDAIEAIPPVIETIAKSAEEFAEATKPAEGQDPASKLKELAEEAGLNPMDTAIAVKNVGTNLKTLAGAPKMATALVETCKFSVKLISQ